MKRLRSHVNDKSWRPIVLAIAVLIGLAWFEKLTETISTPPVSLLRWYVPKTAYMRASELRPVHNWVSFDKISPYLKQAVILAEDDRFFEHNGVDIDAAKKAYKVNKRRKKYARGASTITMQLARNLYLSPHKTPFRKIKEVLIALKLDRTLDKDRILEIYLNVVEWGNGFFGAEAAAKHYFGKSAASLNRHEAAFLAAILPRPKFYDKHRHGPYLARRVASIESRL